MCLTPFRGSNLPTNTIVRLSVTRVSAGTSGEKNSVSMPFGIVRKLRSGKYGPIESLTAAETLMRSSNRRKTIWSKGLIARSSLYPSGTTLCTVPTVTGARERIAAVIGSIGPKGLWTWTTSKRLPAKSRSSSGSVRGLIVRSVSEPFT